MDTLKTKPKDAAAARAALSEIRSGDYTCVLVRNGAVAYRGEGRGVAPIRKLIESEEGRKLLKGAFLADKIIGKAAAVLLVLGKVGTCHGETMSDAACRYLERYGVPYTYAEKVEYIQNRDGTGLCPIEQSVLDIEDPQEGYGAITKTIERLMAPSKR